MGCHLESLIGYRTHWSFMISQIGLLTVYFFAHFRLDQCQSISFLAPQFRSPRLSS